MLEYFFYSLKEANSIKTIITYKTFVAANGS